MIINRKNLAVVLMPALAVLAGCGIPAGRVDPQSESRHLAIDNTKDIIAMTNQFARSLVTTYQIANAEKPPTIAFAEVRNMTNRPMNTNMYLRQVRAELIKNTGGKMTFLDRESSEAVLREREMKRAGEVTASEKKSVLGADFILTGNIDTIEHTLGRERRVYARYAFRLTDAESTAIVWEDFYEVAMEGKSGDWYR